IKRQAQRKQHEREQRVANASKPSAYERYHSHCAHSHNTVHRCRGHKEVFYPHKRAESEYYKQKHHRARIIRIRREVVVIPLEGPGLNPLHGSVVHGAHIKNGIEFKYIAHYYLYYEHDDTKCRQYILILILQCALVLFQHLVHCRKRGKAYYRYRYQICRLMILILEDHIYHAPREYNAE